MHRCVCFFGDDVYDAVVLGVMRFDEVGVKPPDPDCFFIIFSLFVVSKVVGVFIVSSCGIGWSGFPDCVGGVVVNVKERAICAQVLS